jgi:hypothetical protein
MARGGHSVMSLHLTSYRLQAFCTSLKHIWTFSIVLIFIQVPEEEGHFEGL